MGSTIPARPPGVIPVLLGLFVLGVAVAVWLHRHDAPASKPPPGASPPAAAPHSPAYETARATLDRLPVKGWDRYTDFARYRFGEAWSDDVNVEFGHNGCNTRDDVLRRDLADLVVRPGTCYAQSGVLHDPYTGQTIAFMRGPETSNAVQIDHLVSLSDAWYKGAREWDDQRRRDFANDPRNLLAVGAQANFDKAFRDATAWLPPNAAFHCEYVARQIDVKAAYGLWLSRNEKRAMEDVLAGWRALTQFDQSLSRRERVGHPDVVRPGWNRVDEFVVADHRNQPRRRIRQGQRAVVEPGAAAQPNTGTVDRQRGHEHDGRVGHRLGWQPRLGWFEQTELRRDEPAGAVFAPLQRLRDAAGVDAGNRDQHAGVETQQGVQQGD